MRLIEVTVPVSDGEALAEALDEVESLDTWTVHEGPDRLVRRILVPKEGAEVVTDLLSDRFEESEGFRIVLLAVEATMPTADESGKEDGEEEEEDGEEESTPSRVSREELYEDLSSAARPGGVYFVTVGLSTIVAAVGLIRNDVAVVVGAMVIAPLLGPNMALALASTLGDGRLAWRAARSAVGGAVLALLVAVLLGTALSVDPSVPAILRRTVAAPADVGLALAAGSAGALAYTSGLSAAVIGVMVAVALLPPLVVFGLLLGDGHLVEALGALLLTVTNVVCVNLAAVTTFLSQRVRPRGWWAERKARRATFWAVASWMVMLAVLGWIIMIWFG